EVGDRISRWEGITWPGGLLLIRIYAAIMDGAIYVCEIAADVFHHINLARGRPAAIDRIHGHHPERRPITLALGQFRPEFETTVRLAEQSKALQFGGGVAGAIVGFAL